LSCRVCLILCFLDIWVRCLCSMPRWGILIALSICCCPQAIDCPLSITPNEDRRYARPTHEGRESARRGITCFPHFSWAEVTDLLQSGVSLENCVNEGGGNTEPTPYNFPTARNGLHPQIFRSAVRDLVLYTSIFLRSNP
jgi:hypothetical protein